MSQRLTLAAQVRTQTGKGVGRKLRAAGIIPAVFYNAKGESRAVQVDEAALTKLYAATGRNTVFDLEIDDNGKKTSLPCLVWDVEYHPTKKRFLHVDFYGVDLSKELKIKVAIDFVGTAKGTKLGGKLEVYREIIEVLSKPETLPKKITVDVSGLDINQGLRVADLTMPEGVRAAYDINYAIVGVLIPGAEKEEGEGA